MDVMWRYNDDPIDKSQDTNYILRNAGTINDPLNNLCITWGN